MSVLRLCCDVTVCNQVCYNSCNCKKYEEESCKCLTSAHESVLPNLVAPSDCLKSAPETVSEVEPESCEPYDVKNYHPKRLECDLKELIAFFRMYVLALEPLKVLHLSPEMSKVECDDSENDDSENKHVLGCPRFSFALVSYGVALRTASLHVSVS